MGFKVYFIQLLFLLSSSVTTFAKVILPSVFGSNMVLQQNTEVRFWGSADENTSVKIFTSWDKKIYRVKAIKGKWQTYISTPTAGGPYTITLNDGEELALKNVLVGEVWLCAGQSNMAMPVKGNLNQPILHSNDILMDAHQPGIRLFKVKEAVSDTPQSNCNAEWEESSSATVKEFSAVGYLYAKILHEKLKVPIGIIQSAYGATMIESWMSAKSLQPFPNINMIDELNPVKTDKKQPSVVFNAMINPLLGFKIKGVIWYQGEQNAAQPKLYEQLLPAMVKDWRSLWNTGAWPFYYVQIAPFKYAKAAESVPYLREAQQKAMEKIPNSGMVVSIDAGSSSKVHPPNKLVISKRLSYWALSKDYGFKGLSYSGPIFKGLDIDKDTVYLSFDNAENGLTSYDKELLCFEIAGADKVFYPAQAKIIRRRLVAFSDKVKQPVAVRYAFKDFVLGDLYNTEGLPAAPFRTDNW